MLSNAQWVPVSHGLYAPAGSVDDLEGRCRALALVLPAGALLSHYTAGSLLGLWLPQLPSNLPTFATVPGRGTHLARRGLYLACSDGATDGFLHRGELKLAPVPVVLGQLAQDLSCIDMVVAIDSALRQGYCSLAELATSIHPRQRGAPMLRRALRYAHPLSESPWETILRLLHVWAGFEVEPQYVVHDDWGDVVARGDLRLRGLARLHEYDGADHRSRAQHQRDLAREKALARLEVERYGYTASEIARNPAAIVRDAEVAYGLPHRPSRLRRWNLEWNRSSFSTDGARRLQRRLARYRDR